MFNSNTSIAEWREFGRTGFVLYNSRELILYKNNDLYCVVSPPKWRTILEVVNGNRAPIQPMLRNRIFDLFDGIVPIDARDPWPALAKLKENKQLQITMHGCYNDQVLLQRIDNHRNEVVSSLMFDADAVVARWDRLGFEHDKLVWFAALLTPHLVNTADPWLGLMQWKRERNIKLLLSEGIIFDGSGNCVDAPMGLKVAELVDFFNDGEIPPGCVTDWEGPYYTAAEALTIIEKTYGTPDFHKLIFKNNKLCR